MIARTTPCLTLALLCACDPEATRHDPTGDEFRRDTDVLVTSPTGGETVESPFVLTFEAGADVSRVRLDADGETVVREQPVAQAGGSLDVTLEEGRHTLALVGADAQSTELSRHELTIRVAQPDEAWVTITSPADGAEVTNPVRFVVAASAGVDDVLLSADGWELGSVAPGGMLTYEFAGTGYARTVEAAALDDGVEVATDSVNITVIDGTDPDPSGFNDVVVQILESYPTDGTHDYLWDGSYAGTTRDIWYLDTLIAEARDDGACYCVGITWEVYMRAFQQIDAAQGGDGTLNALEVSDMLDFRTDWYVRDLWGPGPSEAFEIYGVGEEVTDLEDLRPGDFVQLWRHSGSGHSVIFDAWQTDASGHITGMDYWSCQGSTDGIGYSAESFGSSGSTMDPSYFYAGRAWMPQDWLPW
ncbi:MAG: hypothetical protein ABIO70_13245 [Pseudomonadota bacterium]